VTFSALHVFDAIFCSICEAVLSVISNSSVVNHPDCLGHDVTSSCESGGRCCWGTRYSCGIESASAARFALATFSQFCSDVIFQVSMYSMMVRSGGLSFRDDLFQALQHRITSTYGPLPNPSLMMRSVLLPSSPPLVEVAAVHNDSSPRTPSFRLSHPPPIM
jgi:hypothetical protein